MRTLLVCAMAAQIVVAASAASQPSTRPATPHHHEDVPTCIALPGASRLTPPCPERPQRTERLEHGIGISVQLPGRELLACQAAIGLEYSQRNAIVRVAGVITTEACPVSSGDYSVEVRVRDEAGDFRLINFNESWHAEDDSPVAFTTDYWIGENVELIRVRTHGLRCTCTGIP